MRAANSFLERRCMSFTVRSQPFPAARALCPASSKRSGSRSSETGPPVSTSYGISAGRRHSFSSVLRIRFLSPRSRPMKFSSPASMRETRKPSASASSAKSSRNARRAVARVPRRSKGRKGRPARARRSVTVASSRISFRSTEFGTFAFCVMASPKSISFPGGRPAYFAACPAASAR